MHHCSQAPFRHGDVSLSCSVLDWNAYERYKKSEPVRSISNTGSEILFVLHDYMYNWMNGRKTVPEIIRFEADKYCILQELLRFITVYCRFYCRTNRHFCGSSVAQDLVCKLLTKL